MSSQIVAILTFGLVLCNVIYGTPAHSIGASMSMSPLCQRGIIDELPEHIKQVCLAIDNTIQLNTALNSFVKGEAAALVSNSEDLVSNMGKRTDVDHVFLRFGKRR